MWRMYPLKHYKELTEEKDAKLNPVQYPRSVFKYKTFDDAQWQRREWELQNVLKSKGQHRDKGL